MKKQTIILQDEIKITAQGKRTGRTATPIKCKETGEFFASIVDASEMLDIKYGKLADHLLGRTRAAKANDGTPYTFERVEDMMNHNDIVVAEKANKARAKSIAEKAKLYDEIIAKHKALAETRDRVNALRESKERAFEVYNKFNAELQAAQVDLNALEKDLANIF